MVSLVLVCPDRQGGIAFNCTAHPRSSVPSGCGKKSPQKSTYVTASHRQPQLLATCSASRALVRDRSEADAGRRRLAVVSEDSAGRPRRHAQPAMMRAAVVTAMSPHRGAITRAPRSTAGHADHSVRSGEQLRGAILRAKVDEDDDGQAACLVVGVPGLLLLTASQCVGVAVNCSSLRYTRLPRSPSRKKRSTSGANSNSSSSKACTSSSAKSTRWKQP